jgi:hypothetical protein
MAMWARVNTIAAQQFALAALLCGYALFGPSVAQAEDAPYLFDVIKQPAYKASWNRLVAPLKKQEPWVVGAKGVGSPAKRLDVEGKTFELFSLCQPHDCHDNMLHVIFTDGGKTAYGAFRTPEGLRYLGGANPAQQQALANSLRQ